MSSTTAWRWELTPRELFEDYSFGKAEPASRLHVEARPFKAIFRPLEDTVFQFQFGVSDQSLDEEVQAILRYQKKDGLPGTGDKRSGVIVFHDMKIVGSLVLPGNLTTTGYRLAVHPEYRQSGLAKKMLVEWCWKTKRMRGRPKRTITLHGAKALLSVHSSLVERAQTEGLSVPDRVLQALKSGKEAEAIIEAAGRA